MPYRTNDELPDSVKNNLPERAQGLYRSAYNDAWSRFSFLTSRENGHLLREENAHRAGWRAVRAEYRRRDGQWVRSEIDGSGTFEVDSPSRRNAGE